MKRWRMLVALACCTAALAGAQPLALPPPPDAGLTQRPGAALPLDAPLRDDLGQPVRLGEAFKPGEPVLLVLGYYRCTELCGLLMHGLLQSLQATGLQRNDWRIVGVSIDPADTPADAHRRRALDLAYVRFLEGAHPAAQQVQLDLLVGDAAQVRRIAQAAGFRFQALAPQDGDAGAAGFAHPATVIVATPEGTISRYLQGVQFEPAQLRLALVEAADGRIGSLGDRLALLCSHFDPVVGRHSQAVMAVLRGVALLTLAALAAFAWWQHVRGRA